MRVAELVHLDFKTLERLEVLWKEKRREEALVMIAFPKP
jgi:hypothetical protein